MGYEPKEHHLVRNHFCRICPETPQEFIPKIMLLHFPQFQDLYECYYLCQKNHQELHHHQKSLQMYKIAGWIITSVKVKLQFPISICDIGVAVLCPPLHVRDQKQKPNEKSPQIAFRHTKHGKALNCGIGFCSENCNYNQPIIPFIFSSFLVYMYSE